MVPFVLALFFALALSPLVIQYLRRVPREVSAGIWKAAIVPSAVHLAGQTLWSIEGVR